MDGPPEFEGTECDPDRSAPGERKGDRRVERTRRARAMLGSFTVPESDLNFRKGRYWSIRGNAADYPASTPLPCPPDATGKLASVPTRLAALPDDLQERLINWGYAMTDVAVRSYADPNLPAAGQFPYKIGVG